MNKLFAYLALGGGLLLSAGAALAQAAPEAAAAVAAVPNKGDTAWMIVSTLLVILMTIPGLALFYGGLVRSKNMLSILAQRLKNITFDLRASEKAFYAKVQELHGNQSFRPSSVTQGSDQSLVNETEESLQQTLEVEDETARRSKEITNIAKSINELAVLFKDLSVLVVEQGTILDRIDYNVLEAKEAMEKADVHLQKTVEIEASGRARGCIYTLTFLIFVCLLLMFLKMQ